MSEGRMEALLQIITDQTQELMTVKENLVETSLQVRLATQELKDLREITFGLEDLLKRNSRADWMTSSQLAKELQVHEQTIRNWYDSGVIPGHKIAAGGHVRFDRQEVTEAIRAKGIQ
jgi:excisionase family DNA binding protein